MKFDYDQAWRETVRLIGANAGLIATLAGIFFFLPYAALVVMLPGMASFVQPDASAGSDAAVAAMMAFYADYWWLLLLLGVVQGIGILAMLALLRRDAPPTVGEALASGAKGVLPYYAAQIIQAAALVLIAMLLLAPAALTGSTGLGVLGGLIALVLCAYVVTKLSLIAPVISVEGQRNPITALRRSWTLTRGNSVRLFFFYLLLLVAFVVASAVVSMVLSLVFALLGAKAALFGTAVSTSLVNALLVVLMVGVMAAVHRQLARLGARGGPLDAEG